MSQQSIVFFDGVCGLCNRMVDFVLREDREETFLFAPLQGETFRRVAPDRPKPLNPESIAVLRRGPEKELLLQRSAAVLYILSKLPRYRWLARIGQIFPTPVRDTVYRLIASRRYKIWGKRETCRLPTAEERARFLP